MMNIDRPDRIRACLLAGAVGDALGAPIEFHSLAAIERRHGAGGLCDYVPAYGRTGAVTDDTQMTLFTAEGLLDARRAPGTDPLLTLDAAYRRWLRTQREPCPESHEALTGLLAESALWALRAPGNTCLGALGDARRRPGTRADNRSKGCGGVMRAAPVGLLAGIDDPFALGCAAARLTHGHPGGYLPAGVLALLVRRLIEGADLRTALAGSLARLAREPGQEEVAGLLHLALALADGPGPHDAQELMRLGGGWVGDEALAIAVWCALVAPDLEAALVLAVNHDGDSDSTGAITGHLLGAALGTAAIPARWLEALELRGTIERMAQELAAG